MLWIIFLAAGLGVAASQSTCQNINALCGASPGWPLTTMCATHQYVLDNCPEFCGVCSCASDPRGPCYNGGIRGGNPANYNEHTCDCNCVGAWIGDVCQTCGLQCANGGILDTASCSCRCQPGWDGPTCSDPCQDDSVNCGANPGWPTTASCQTDYVLDLCHKFCGVCTAAGSGTAVTQATTTTRPTQATTTHGSVIVPAGSCPTGYLQMPGSSLCIRAFMDQKTWYDAGNTCAQYGGTLVMPKSEDIHQFCLLLKNGADPNSKFWIGMTDVGTEGQWRYVDGPAVVGFNKWATGEPNNSGGDEGCGEYLPAGQDTWNDLSCTTPQKFICQTILP
ncbi:C-type lectin domain family 18 member A-like [Branchiostoma lanceolatum]|uniref:C-type lectin domain family 18 member A-like n=1 Tax=Branchiostoma lanceolatum TaxID=7740 RepID=UPI00345345BB